MTDLNKETAKLHIKLAREYHNKAREEERKASTLLDIENFHEDVLKLHEELSDAKEETDATRSRQALITIHSKAASLRRAVEAVGDGVEKQGMTLILKSLEERILDALGLSI